MTKIPSFMMTISTEEFNLLRELVYHRFGINLTDQKRSLLVGRLQKLLRSSGYVDFKSYYHDLVTDKTGKKLDELINRVSTNYSYFFREEAHFDFFLKNALPQVVEHLTTKKSNDIRIWTAGCSTGEEPYMLIMLMHEYFGMNYKKWNGGVLATDISNNALSAAQDALYPVDRINRVPAYLRKKYFIDLRNGLVGIKDGIKQEITLRRFNLMNTTFPFKKPFQIIFCRNVMIYFDKTTRDALVKKFHQALIPGGYFFIGHSETLGREQSMFKYLLPACYQKI